MGLIQPFLHKLLDSGVWFLSTLWEGFKDVVDNAATIVFCLFIVFSAAVWADRRADKMCYDEVAKIHSEYAKKLKQPVRTVPQGPRNFLDDIFSPFGVFR